MCFGTCKHFHGISKTFLGIPKKSIGFSRTFLYAFQCSNTLRRLIIVHLGANNEYTGGPGGPGTGFCGPEGGLVVINVVASHYIY